LRQHIPKAGQQENEMWNAMHTKSLVSAILISVAIQGSLLWRFNHLATDGAVNQPQPAAASLLVQVPADAPALHEVTLEPVVIVGRRDAATVEPDMALASTQPPAPEVRTERARPLVHM
jgi:hypothetical protein